AVYGSYRWSIALSASWIAACRMARVRDCAIGLVPCDGANASVATAFQCVTALALGVPAECVTPASWARPGVASVIAMPVSTATRESFGMSPTAGPKGTIAMIVFIFL